MTQIDKIIQELNKITDVYKSGFTLADTTMGMLREENAKLKQELAELRNICTKEQLSEVDYEMKRKVEDKEKILITKKE